jgi:DNA/RNA endonuclease YhcR with UshA esterase domain
LTDKGTTDPAPTFLTPQEAAAKIDHKCTVRYVVKSAGLSTNRKTLFLNSETNYRAETNFTVVLHGIDEGSKDPTELPAVYQGKTIQVTGLVSLYQGRPQIVAADAAQIQVVNQP